jgi:hypothetical protein
MSWKADAKKVAAGKWIRFDSSTPQHTLLFVGEPKKVEKESTLPGSKGEIYFQMSFPVEEDGESKILEPNKSLLTQLIEEDDEEDIIGAEFLIKCLNPEKKTQWKIRRIKTEINAAIERAGAHPPARPAPAEPEAIPEAEEQDVKAKEKFKTEVKKRARKVKKQEDAEAGEEQHAEAVRESEEAE